MTAFTSVNPATGELLDRYPLHTAAETEAALEAAWAAFLAWRRLPVTKRVAPLNELSRRLGERTEAYARLMTQEMGKPIAQARGELAKCRRGMDYYAAHAAELLAPQPVATEAARSYVAFEPLGPILAIMPWNYPFWQVIRVGVPALLAGNALLLKHAPSTTGCALALEELFRDAGFPPGLFQHLRLPVDRIEALIADRRVRGVTLTGSSRAGRAVAAAAGRALKKTSLELGGSDPYVVLADADLAAAAALCVAARMSNTGQSCIAAKRFIVPQSRRARFETEVVGLMKNQRLGDPLEAATELGPMARLDLRDRLHDQVQRSVAQGARLLLGGEVPPGPGAFYPATVLTGVRAGMAAYEEELFGPVAAILPVADEAEALAVANDTVYGLGAAVLTADAARGERIAREELEAGNCFVNAQVRSDPRLPFGGIKDSGYGRELGGFGLHEFTNIKTVYVK